MKGITKGNIDIENNLAGNKLSLLGSMSIK